MLLPIRGSHDRSDCCARWRPQHCNDAGVLGLGPRWRLRRREHRLSAGFGLAALPAGYAAPTLCLGFGLGLGLFQVSSAAIPPPPSPPPAQTTPQAQTP